MSITYKNVININPDTNTGIKLQEVLDAFPSYLMLVDENHRIVMANEKISTNFGKDSNDIIGKYCPKVIHGIDKPFPGCPLEDAIKQGCSIEKELFDPFYKKWFLSCIYITKCKTNDDSRVYLHNIQDITEKKEAQENLKKSYKRLQKTLDNVISTCGSIVEINDPYTAGHQSKVTKLAVAIAQELCLPEDIINTIKTSALIHDMGKIYIPTSILAKSGKLTDIEFALIKTHVQYGYDVLKEIDFGYPVADITLQHHERLDGFGYPQGLKNGDILFEAKIISVADTIEAMTAHRPYRPALGVKKALKEIEEGKGKLYDPRVIDACLNLFYKKDFKF